MKKALIFLIKTYQKLPLHSHTACRFQPTCSNYAIEALETYGFFKGSWLASRRIIRCNPWGKMGYDPVPKRSKK